MFRPRKSTKCFDRVSRLSASAVEKLRRQNVRLHRDGSSDRKGKLYTLCVADGIFTRLPSELLLYCSTHESRAKSA